MGCCTSQAIITEEYPQEIVPGTTMQYFYLAEEDYVWFLFSMGLCIFQIFYNKYVPLLVIVVFDDGKEGRW